MPLLRQQGKALFAVLLVFLLGCATISQPTADDALKNALDRERSEKKRQESMRIAKVAYQLYSASKPLSGEAVKAALPLVLENEMGKMKFWNLTPPYDLKVVGVLENLWKEGASIRPGDVVTEINGHLIAGYGVDQDSRFYKMLQKNPLAKTARVGFRRGREKFEVEVPVLHFGQFSPPRQTTGLLSPFIENDDELAFVLANDLTHERFGHKRQSVPDNSITPSEAAAEVTSRVLLATLFGSSAAGYIPSNYRWKLTSYTVKDEAEADSAAIPLLKRAGFDPLKGLDLMQRLEIELAKNKEHGLGDYVSVDRIVLYEKELQRLGITAERNIRSPVVALNTERTPEPIAVPSPFVQLNELDEREARRKKAQELYERKKQEVRQRKMAEMEAALSKARTQE